MKIEADTITLTRDELHSMMERAARFAIVHTLEQVADMWIVNEVPKQAAQSVWAAMQKSSR